MTDTLPQAAQADHLTDTLRRTGALGSGRVCDVTVASTRDTILSRIIRLRLSYEGADDAAPSLLILKTGHPDRGATTWNAGRQEVAFYTQVAAAVPTPATPRCFEAHWSADNTWHLLLEDLSETHAGPTTWPLPPALAQCEAIVRALARFHAAWWNDPRLGTTIGAWSSAEATAAYLRRLADQVAQFADRLGDRLPRERRDLYERLLASAPDLVARYHSHRNMTIVHGDAHMWNCFLPKDGSEDVRFFDWDSWHPDTGTDDLAYMIAMHWYPDRRHRFEQPLIDLYHATLAAHRVAYDRAALADDYRLSVLWLIVRPVWQSANNIPPAIWWNNLERIFLAVDDLGCRELLKG
jgi:hypothetical protein